MKSLPIVWQKLVNADGKTCDRCDATYQETQRAVGTLTEALRPLKSCADTSAFASPVVSGVPASSRSPLSGLR